MKKEFKFFIPKIYYIHLGIIIGISIIGLIVFRLWLSSYTNHLENIKVPDFTNMEFESAKLLAEESNISISILDTVYSESIRPGAIVYHKPDAGTFVKEHRTIYVSINSKTPILVTMPKATEVSLRQASQMLERVGLQVGNIVYKPDFADNYVFEQRFNNRIVREGVKVPKGSKIDFVVGKGGDNTLIIIPNLMGMTYQQMFDSLTHMGVTVNAMFGEEIYETPQDSLQSVVWKQSPLPENNNMMMLGESIDVWLMKNEQSGN